MTASMLRKSMGAETGEYAPKDIRPECAQELPRRSTRELEAAFAEEDKRWPLAGLALGLTVSAGLWAAIAAMVF